jgi:hypothetical protein
MHTKDYRQHTAGEDASMVVADVGCWYRLLDLRCLDISNELQAAMAHAGFGAPTFGLHWLAS